MRTSVILSITAALAAVVAVSSHEASADSKGGGARPGFVWVDKKGEPGHWERARAETKSVPVVRDHRQPATPVVRDHRTSAPAIVNDHRKAPVVNDHRKTTGTYATRPAYGQPASSGGVTVTSTPRPKKTVAPYQPAPLGIPSYR